MMIPTRCLFLIVILVNSATSRHLSTIDTSIAFAPCKKFAALSNPKLRRQKSSIPAWLKVPIQKDDEERLKNGIGLEQTPSSWNKKHLIRGVNELRESTDEEFLESEVAAAVDAHDCDDPGMEAAMMERAVVMAVDMEHQLKKDAEQKQTQKSEQEQWSDEHLVHGVKQIHEETNEELLNSEEAAAVDAHDCDDPGMEAAMMERAVMMAADMAHKIKEDASTKNLIDQPAQQEKWDNEHLVHGAKQIHEETNEELLNSEEAAAVDAHDCDDPGMEAAMMERAVMMAADMAHKIKEDASTKNLIDQPSQQEKWDNEHLVHGAKQIHEETNEELLNSEEAAAVDAHDCDDPGMEAAMMERAVMMAADMAHKMKKESKN